VGAIPRRTWLSASGTLDPERRSVIFEVVARLVFHPIVVLSLYLLFCAENLPGGGFTAGLVAGLALAVRYLAGGRHELAAAAPVDAGFLLGLGLLTMTLTGLIGLIAKGSVLKSATYYGNLPLIGDFHAASPVVFDAGVYLLVLGVVLDVLRSIGSGIDRRVERDLRQETSGDPADGGHATGGGARPPGEAGT
jgi:multicomponent Na+:H+ antiporter subunit A